MNGFYEEGMELKKYALYMKTGGLSIRLDRGEQKVTELEPEEGVVLKTGDDFEKALPVSDPCFRKIFRKHVGGSEMLGMFLNFVREPSAFNFETPCIEKPSEYSLREKIFFLSELMKKLFSYSRKIVQVMVGYEERDDIRGWTDGLLFLKQHIITVRISATVIAHFKGRDAFDFLVRARSGGFEVARIDGGDAEKLAKTAVELLRAGRIEPGFYDCVASPDVSGLIAHESFGHGVELDMFVKNRARARDFMGKYIAGSNVDLYDDPAFHGGFGQYYFDDEGTIARPTRIISAGRLVSGISDLSSALMLGLPPTGNGRRESFRRKAYARMSNTYFAPADPGKTRTRDEIIGSIEKGVFLERASNGMEDPKDWGIQCEAHIGREIRNGRFTGRLFSPVGISGYVPELLSSISDMGNDVELNGGFCGKGYKEIVRVADGGPTMRMKARLS